MCRAKHQFFYASRVALVELCPHLPPNIPSLPRLLSKVVVMKIDVSGLSYNEIACLLGRVSGADAVFQRVGRNVVLQIPACVT